MHTTFPELKIKAMVTVANHLELYVVFQAQSAIVFRSSLLPRFTVDTIFCSCGMISELSEGCVVEVMGEGYRVMMPGLAAVLRVCEWKS